MGGLVGAGLRRRNCDRGWSEDDYAGDSLEGARCCLPGAVLACAVIRPGGGVPKQNGLALRGSGATQGGNHRVRTALVATQVAVALVLLMARAAGTRSLEPAGVNRVRRHNVVTINAEPAARHASAARGAAGRFATS
jgi:hypothetical protein